jgi:hypothetical protein
MSSFDSHPEKGGRPDSARPPTRKQMKVNGIAFRNPLILSIDCSPAIALITEPADMNNSALKKACVIRWNMPAENAPTETAMIM